MARLFLLPRDYRSRTILVVIYRAASRPPFRFRRLFAPPSSRHRSAISPQLDWNRSGSTKNPISSTIASRHVSRLVRLISRPDLALSLPPPPSGGRSRILVAGDGREKVNRNVSFSPSQLENSIWKTITGRDEERRSRLRSRRALRSIYWIDRCESNGWIDGRGGWSIFLNDTLYACERRSWRCVRRCA